MGIGYSVPNLTPLEGEKSSHALGNLITETPQFFKLPPKLLSEGGPDFSVKTNMGVGGVACILCGSSATTVRADVRVLPSPRQMLDAWIEKHGSAPTSEKQQAEFEVFRKESPLAVLVRNDGDGTFVIWAFEPAWPGQVSEKKDNVTKRDMYRFASIEDIVQDDSGRGRFRNYFCQLALNGEKSAILFLSCHV